ncbi:MAG: M48 family metalloprotease [Proteobacteria bacterium]|nr:M48 family metalloprotease [Pseudomonadota bacterium]
MKNICYLILLLTFISINGCAVNPVTGKQDLVLMSEQSEIALGRKTNKEVLQQYIVYDNPELQAYVNEVGQKLAMNSHRNNLIYRFTVLDSKDVNAFALPGGYIFITRGLMAYLNSEAELAAVLGHEIGHVTARHSVRQYSAAQLTGIGTALASIFIPGMNQASNQLMQVMGTAFLRGYGREHELEADKLGAEYVARTNYDTESMLDVIRVLKNQETFETQRAKSEGREPRIYHGLFSTHPDHDTRLQEIVEYASKYQSQTGSRKGREEYLNKIDGLIFGDSPQQGITRGNNFYHKQLDISIAFPEKWNITNLPDKLIITAPQGVATQQILLEDLNKRISPREFMIQRLGLKTLTNDKPLKINGLEAHTGIATINTGNGKRAARFTVIYFNNQAYILVGVTKDPKAMSHYDAAFMETARSFHQMTQNERLLAKPLRLKIVNSSNETNFKSLAQQSPLEKYQEEQLRLLNGLYPQGKASSKALLKIIN